ncbi:heavy-metal-associated domain-containing protein [Streptococcus massiliensis]|uniref:Copper chaperone n=1 Tax=Streptococcus massiliensis TaxID=313439 RepID=A0A380KXH5_9STRE|nr:heavy metal-associated domain-containing protein [Streptococcus massiliensis]SUN76398.1 copper chaperone [Streptococcus massiliensis]
MKQTIKLENLSCQNCVKHVTKHFEQLAGVSEVTIDLASQTALVETSQAHSLSDYQTALAKTVYKALSVD